MALEIAITTEASTEKRITIAGSLDSFTAPDLQKIIATEINESISTTIIDFKDLDFLSSAGLRVIFMTKKFMDNSGGKLLLVNLQPQIKKVFEIVQVLDHMSIFKDQGEMDAYLTAMQNKVIDGE
jgi:anti-sigma B factor antagonist